MQTISYNKISQDDISLIETISNWYEQEWNIPKEKTITRLSDMSASGVHIQMMMNLNGEPIATGGVYDHVALLDREPRFNIYKPWLALVYTLPEYRGNGYGKLLCEKIQEQVKEAGIKEMYLFTHTAESLYKRLGWQEMERLVIGDRNIVVMKLMC